MLRLFSETELFHAVDAFSHLFSRFKVRHVFRRQGHRISGFRITSDPGRAIMERETSKTADLDASPRRERIRHELQQGPNRQLNIFIPQLDLLAREGFDEFRLSHVLPYPCRLPGGKKPLPFMHGAPSIGRLGTVEALLEQIAELGGRHAGPRPVGFQRLSLFVKFLRLDRKRNHALLAVDRNE